MYVCVSVCVGVCVCVCVCVCVWVYVCVCANRLVAPTVCNLWQFSLLSSSTLECVCV